MITFPGSFSVGGQSFSVWSGNPITSEKSADGSRFYGMNAKRAGDRVMFYVVVRRDRSGALTLMHQSVQMPLGAGQGVLKVQGDRTLEASYFVEAGDGKPHVIVPIAGFVPFP